jgi:hypothetical protein
MVVSQIENNEHRLFGRADDLARLADRAAYKGLTAVVARAQMGKSWLLAEVARRLSRDHEVPRLIGIARAVGQTPDLLLRSIIDLYGRFIDDAALLEKVRTIWQQQRDGLLPAFALTLGKIVSALPHLAKPAGKAVEAAIRGAVAASETLSSGGVQLPVLQYEQARELVKQVAEISGRPIALFLDQWDETPKADMEAKTLAAFLHSPDEWPLCHVFLTLRPDEPQFSVIRKLVASSPGPACIYNLGEMDLSDLAEKSRLMVFIKGVVPAAKGVDVEKLLSLIDNYPGVIYRWTSDYQIKNMKSEDDLARIAHDAQFFRFQELEELIPALDGDRRKLAGRLALVSSVAQADAWASLKDVIGDGIDIEVADDLKISGVLEASDPPSFGHAKRWDAARELFRTKRPQTLRTEGPQLAVNLAKLIDIADLTDQRSRHAAWALGYNLMLAALIQDWGEHHLGIGQGAMSLFGVHVKLEWFDSPVEPLLSALRYVRQNDLPVTFLLGALVNEVGHYRLWNDQPVVEEVLALSKAWSKDPIARSYLSYALSQAIVQTVEDTGQASIMSRLEPMLSGLHDLFQEQPGDETTCRNIAASLEHVLRKAADRVSAQERDLLFDDLCALPIANGSSAIRQGIIGILETETRERCSEDDMVACDKLLGRIRKLARAWPHDTAVRSALAQRLCDVADYVRTRRHDSAQHSRLLDELRSLYLLASNDAAIRLPLAAALANALSAEPESELSRSDSVLAELRDLAHNAPEDSPTQLALCVGLSNAIGRPNNDSAQRDLLIGELRSAAASLPDSAEVRALVDNAERLVSAGRKSEI